MLYTPQLVKKEVKNLIKKFIWNNKSPKIAYDNIIQQIDKGGLKLVDVELKIKSLMVSWVNRIGKDKDSKWIKLPEWFFNSNNLSDFFNSNRNPVACNSLFYKEIHEVWSGIRRINNPCAELIKEQRIWNNRYITVNKEYINWPQWKKHGIEKIKDLLKEENKFLSVSELMVKFNIKINFLDGLTLRKSIPKEWVITLENNNVIKSELMECLIRLHNCKVDIKEVYWLLVQKKLKEPVHQKKWMDEFPLMKEVEGIWPRIYTSAHVGIREVAIQSLQYRIINRIINCQSKLYEWKITNSRNCIFCNNNDSIQHFFIDCENIKMFWKGLFSWWNALEIYKLDLYRPELRENILFGFNVTEEVYNVLNLIILIAKSYIYRNRLHNDNKIYLCVFLKELRFKLLIESLCNNKDSERTKLEIINSVLEAL
jgi:hypothetical protein